MEEAVYICKKCGYKQKIKVYSRQDAEREGKRLVPPRCRQCGSLHIERRG